MGARAKRHREHSNRKKGADEVPSAPVLVDLVGLRPVITENNIQCKDHVDDNESALGAIALDVKFKSSWPQIRQQVGPMCGLGSSQLVEPHKMAPDKGTCCSRVPQDGPTYASNFPVIDEG